MAKKQIDLGLTGLDELFMDDRERAESKLPKIHEIPLSEIDEFPNHPFHVRLDEDMDQLVESIKERGIITPVTLRQKPDGRYEIVSGHRRTKACELAGLATVKAEIKELSRDEAIILMVESNLQRTTILPSEKAFSYKMRLEAMNRQGQRTDLTSSPLDNKLQGVTSAQQISDKTNDSQPQIYRYIRLTHLIPPLLDLVDSGKIAFRPAVELSYLTEEEQNSLLDSINSEQSTHHHHEREPGKRYGFQRCTGKLLLHQWERCFVFQVRQHPDHHKNRLYFSYSSIQCYPEPALCGKLHRIHLLQCQQHLPDLCQTVFSTGGYTAGLF